MADDRMVTIRHKDGREYAIHPKDFTRANVHPKDVGSYADQGFEIVRYEDGTDYEGPKSKRDLDKVEADKQAAREAKPAPKGKAD